MSFLHSVNYQPLVNALIKLGKQLNKPAYRFLKGELIALGLEKITEGRLKYLDEEGFDSLDIVTGDKYELKSVANMFSAKGTVSGRVSIANTNKSSLSKTFDYLLCIQSDPKKFAIARLSWEDCEDNIIQVSGQFNLAKGIEVKDWICKNSTNYTELPEETLDVRKLLQTIL